MKPFLRCPKPFDDESFGGYILRLSDDNHYPTFKYIYNLGIKTKQRVAINPYKIDDKETDIGPLSKLTRVPEKVLWSMLLPYKKVEVDVDPKKLRGLYRTNTRANIFSTNNRVCVECLKKEKYIRKYWDIFLSTVCIEHSCFLIDECPQCNKKLKYNRSRIEYCSCGFNLCEIESSKLDNSHEQALTRLILNKCGYVNEDLDENNPLSFADLPQIVDCILTASRLLFKQTYISSPKITVKELHNVIIHTFRMFENWPCSYYKILDTLQERNRVYQGIGIGRFGQYYQVIFGPSSKHNNEHLDILRIGFEEYLKTSWVDGNASLLKNIQAPIEGFKFVAKMKAAELLNKSEETIGKLLETGALKGVIKNRMYLIDINSIEEYKEKEPSFSIKKSKKYEELGEFLTKIELERFLSISEATIKELVLDGIFHPVSGPEIDNKSTRVYRTEEMKGIFKMLNMKVKSNDNSDSEQLVSFHEARNLMNCSFSQFFRYIFNNDIKIFIKRRGMKLI